MSITRLRAFVGVAAMAVLLGLVLVGTAYADEPTPTLTSATVNAGQTDSVSGGGCAARVSVQVSFDNAVLVTVQSGATGQYSAHLIVPRSAISGVHRVTVVCRGASGTPVTETAAVNVELPFTGSDTVPLAAAGFSLLCVGGLLATQHRRRLVPAPGGTSCSCD